MNLGDLEGACMDLQKAQQYGSNVSKDFVEYECNPDFIRNMMVKMFYKKTTVYPELGYRPRYTRADTLRGALRPERTCFDVHFYDLYVRIIPRGKKIRKPIRGFIFEVKKPTQTIQIDLFDNFKINSALSGMKFRSPGAGNTMPFSLTFPKQLETGEFHEYQYILSGKTGYCTKSSMGWRICMGTG